MGLSPSGMGEAVVRNLKKRTGKSLAQWAKVATRSRLTEPKELRRWLKAKHDLGCTTCWIIADSTLRKPGVGATKRLQLTTAFSDNATHCVRLTETADIDAQLEKWLKAACGLRR